MLPRELHRPTIYIAVWIVLGIVLPALPILFGIVIAMLRGVEISLPNLLDGTELLLISLGLITATSVDLLRTELDWENHFRLFFLVLALLFLLGIINIFVLSFIYVNDRVVDLEFNTDAKFTLVFIFTLSISLITIALQSYIGYTRYKTFREETT